VPKFEKKVTNSIKLAQDCLAISAAINGSSLISKQFRLRNMGFSHCVDICFCPKTLDPIQ